MFAVQEKREMQGFYGVYYTGANGAAAFGFLLRDGRVYGIDPAGGDVSGTYSTTPDGGLDLALTFNWPVGAVLVTGQTLSQPMTVNSNVTISASTLAGGHQLVNLPVGPVNVRIVRKVTL